MENLLFKTKYIKYYLTAILILVFVPGNVMNIPLSDDKGVWVFNVLKDMTLDEKIGQLFVLRAQSDWGEKDAKFFESQIEKYNIGGIIFFKGNILDQGKLTNRFQSVSKIPLLVALDAEWGLGMRLSDGISFPRQMTLGAISDNELVYKMGLEIGRQLKRLGVDINFAPVADINTNPDNPVIYDRSFGDNASNVAEKSVSYMKGLQDAGVIACAKHFPGHGSTIVDSHLDLPKIDKSAQEILDFEIMPFKSLIDNGVKSVMAAHLQIPSLDNTKNIPASLSSKIIGGILRDSLNFDGLVITDAMEMKGVSSYFSSGEASVLAFLAGNDILELPDNIAKAFDGIKKAVKKGRISESRLDKSVKRILMAKYDQGYSNYKPVVTDRLDEDINSPGAYVLKSRLYENSLIALGNKSSYIPVLPEEYDDKIAILSLGLSENTIFESRIKSYFDPEILNAPLLMDDGTANKLFNKLKEYDKIIVCLYGLNKKSSLNFGLSSSSLNLLNELNKKTHLYVVNFNTPYALSLFDDNYCILQAFENDQSAQEAAAQAILGVETISGKLPVMVSHDFKFGDGQIINKSSVLGYSLPERVGIDGQKLNFKIDSIADILIKDGSAPGCQVLVARKGRIVFEKCYGYTDYTQNEKVVEDDLYDLASMTKVLATDMAIMKLYDEKKINIFNKVTDYIDNGLKNSNKSDLIIIDLLSHHAGLTPWIPAYKSTLDTINGEIFPSPKYYSKIYSDEFNTKVAEDMYLRRDYKDTIWQKIIDSPVKPKGNYKYSDLGLIIMKEMVEKVTDTTLDDFVSENFYKPLGLKHTTFNPWMKFPISEIAPTEEDKYWRNQTIRGSVHDMWAAMSGGVSGHAGLFSDSRDIARLSQMMLNGGFYGNKRYFDYSTVYLFTTRYYLSSRRGIGWDMKELDKNKDCNISELATPSTYVHYGFTGTCVWIDPQNELIYIFLSNRTFPTMDNNKLEKKLSTKIQTAIYESIIDN
ncbi:MAG: glycoside hydrolase family 3 N-terminal domain-containing protein [Saprospiraceae bacterium]